jgi:GNAT superfamily N-acetyltransferase
MSFDARTDSLDGLMLRIQDVALDYEQRYSVVRPLRKIELSWAERDDICTFDGSNPDPLHGFDSTRWLMFRDIIVSGEARRLGLATAVLHEVADYANRNSLAVVAEFSPGFAAPLEEISSYARWYHRLGFRTSEQSPERWQLGTAMWRIPVTRSAERGPATITAN